MGLGALSFGCAAEVGTDTETSRSDVTHAVVVVERSVEAESLEAVKAQAFAGFLSLPPELEPNQALPVAGLALDLPVAGACKRVERDPKPVPAEELARAELLDAGEVTLVAGGVVTTLLPLTSVSLPVAPSLPTSRHSSHAMLLASAPSA
jgi:hypothetical protein